MREPNTPLAAGFLVVVFVHLLLASPVMADTKARVGVLAYRGSDTVAQKWLGLQNYLDSTVSGWSFEMVPVTLRSAKTKIENGELDFLLTNPGHFVDLKKEYPLSVIASRRQQKSDGTYASEFGSTIITRADSGLAHLQDIAGKKVAAVDPHAFGGFQTAWRAFNSVGVDLFDDTAELIFVGFPMDQIVFDVIQGRADVGIIRSGMLEEFIANGKVSADAITVLNADTNYTHPDKTSTRLYPEWPFVAFGTTDSGLRDSVALALLMSQNNPATAQSGMTVRWSAPLSYRTVEDLAQMYASRIARQKRLPMTVILATAAMVTSVVIFAMLGFRRSKKRFSSSVTTIAEAGIDHGSGVDVTKREQEILALISKGHSTKEMARILEISPKTVEFHRANLLKKFNARTSSQLISLTS